MRHFHRIVSVEVWLTQLELYRNRVEETVVIKAVRGHPRVEIERGFLASIRGRSPHIRPLVDTVIEPPSPVTIVLKHLEDNLLNASAKKTLNHKELKFVSRGILEAFERPA